MVEDLVEGGGRRQGEVPRQSTVSALLVLAQGVGRSEDAEQAVPGTLNVFEQRRRSVILVNEPGDGRQLEMRVDLASDADEIAVDLKRVDERAKFMSAAASEHVSRPSTAIEAMQ